MSPREVGGLQALAQAHGGTLTRNPTTGLPEAGFLDSILPMIAGAILTPLTGGLINPLDAGLLVGGADAAITGDLGKGLMAGLGAYGGGSLAAATGILGANAFGLASTFGGASTAAAPAAAAAAAPTAAVSATPSLVDSTTGNLTAGIAVPGGGVAGAGNVIDYTASAAAPAAPAAAAAAPAGSLTAPAVTPMNPDMASRIAQAGTAASKGLFGTGLSTMQMAGIGIPLLMGMNSSAPGATTPAASTVPPYLGPYAYPARTQTVPTNAQILGNQLPSNYRFISPLDPTSYVPQSTLTAAKGGQIKGLHAPLSREHTSLPDGSFVMDARSVSEIGNGSSSAGAQILRRIGGQHLHGPGDGVSDSIPAKVDAHTDARVARDEVKFSPEAVKHLGGGDEKKGAAKLYHLMHKAGEARRHAARGGDTRLRGLLAIK